MGSLLLGFFSILPVLIDDVSWVQMPAQMVDAEWYGIVTDADLQLWCDCALVPRRRIAFEGTNFGRRFLGYNYECERCTFFHWVDLPHSLLLQRTMMSLWLQLEIRDDLEEEEQERHQMHAEEMAAELTDVSNSLHLVVNRVDALRFG